MSAPAVGSPFVQRLKYKAKELSDAKKGVPLLMTNVDTSLEYVDFATANQIVYMIVPRNGKETGNANVNIQLKRGQNILRTVPYQLTKSDPTGPVYLGFPILMAPGQVQFLAVLDADATTNIPDFEVLLVLVAPPSGAG